MFDAFFRRAARGDPSGFPRFKSFKRFTGWGYKTHLDGWKMMGVRSVVNNGKYAGTAYGAVRLSGVGTVSLRGRARFSVTPKTAEVMRKGDDWYLSVTFNVDEANLARTSGKKSASFDWASRRC